MFRIFHYVFTYEATASAPDHVGASGLIGGGWLWWQRCAGITGRILMGLKEWCMYIRSPPPIKLWWWMRWCGTGWWWRWTARKIGESVDKRVGIIMPHSTLTMAWLHHRTHYGSRVHLLPWSDRSIGQACIIMSGRQSEWSTTHTKRRGPSQRRCTGNVWLERDLSIRSDRRNGCSAGISRRTWQLDRWQFTGENNMGEWQRRDLVGQPCQPGNNHGRTAWPSQQREARGNAQSRDSRNEQQQGQKCGSILCTSMSKTPWSFRRKGKT